MATVPAVFERGGFRLPLYLAVPIDAGLHKRGEALFKAEVAATNISH